MLLVHTLPLGLLSALCSDVVSEPLVSAELKEWLQCFMVVFLSLVPLQLLEGVGAGESHIQKPCLRNSGLGRLDKECQNTQL